MTTSKETVRLAAVGDLHYPKISPDTLQGLLSNASEQVDVLLLCGALTDYGRPEEARLLAKVLAAYAKMPLLAVLGNHDYESGEHDEV
jgi:predicted MPP superfamily phosphohydrolase